MFSSEQIPLFLYEQYKNIAHLLWNIYININVT